MYIKRKKEPMLRMHNEFVLESSCGPEKKNTVQRQPKK